VCACFHICVRCICAYLLVCVCVCVRVCTCICVCITQCKYTKKSNHASSHKIATTHRHTKQQPCVVTQNSNHASSHKTTTRRHTKQRPCVVTQNRNPTSMQEKLQGIINQADQQHMLTHTGQTRRQLRNTHLIHTHAHTHAHAHTS
jgi:hypothetical protein